MRSFSQRCLVGSSWCDAIAGKTYNVVNPATGAVVCAVPYCGREDTVKAIDAAYDAFQSYSVTTGVSRARFLRSYGDAVQRHKLALADVITSECAKPKAEALAEVLYSYEYIMWFAGEAERCYGDIIPSPRPDTRQLVIRQPVGVVGSITPWNFPMAMMVRKMCAAIAAGCTFVAKPADNTPLSAMAMVDLALECGLPKGVLNLVVGDYVSIGEELCTNRKVRKITFTGSTRTGQLLTRMAVGKRVTMELGGNASFVIFDDADIDLAVKGVMTSKFRNAGQVCIAPNRFLVHRDVVETFQTKLSAAISQLKVGNGAEDGVTLGPLINHTAVAKVTALVEKAKAHGAKEVYRHAATSMPPSGGLGSFQAPVILTDVAATSPIFAEEIFGPVVSITPFDSESEALSLANATEFGLASYVYTKDLSRAFRVSEGIKAGMIGVNDTGISSVSAPFGGVGLSGSGREGSKYGLDDFTDIKYVCMHIAPKL